MLARCPDAAVYTADRSVLQALTGYALTRGVLCAMRRPQPRSVEALCRDARRVAVLEGIVDSTNIGAIFRGAAALGMDAVLLSPSCCDPLCRRAVRVSMGTVFQVPWATLGDSPADWPEAGMARLHALGFKTAAMALDSRAVSIDDPALRAEPRLAIVLGTEGDGLARTTIAHCDYTVMIPMQHGVDSLNVAAAGAVAFWELRARFKIANTVGADSISARAALPLAQFHGRIWNAPLRVFPGSVLHRKLPPSICHKNITKLLRPADRNVGGACCF